MPNVKDTKHHSKRHQQHSHGEKDPREDMRASSSESRPKRRPGREEPEASDADVKVVDVDGYEAASETSHQSEASSGENADGADDRPQVEIRFFGSELLRAKFPQPFDVAEKVASDWVTGGNFDNLPIKQPLAQFAAQKGLQRAKEIEKKVLESPVTEKVAMQALTVGMKAQGMFEQIRERLNNKKKD